MKKICSPFYRFLEYIGLLDIRYYDNVLNLLVERKFDKVKLIVAPFFQGRMSFLNEYCLNGHKKETLCRYAQYQLHLIKFWGSKISGWLMTKKYLQQQRNGRTIQIHTRSLGQNGMIHFRHCCKKWLATMNMYKVEETKL